MSLLTAFGAVREALERAGVAYAIGGSWASTAHGEPRATNDIDFIASFNTLALGDFLDALGPEFYFDAVTAREAIAHGRPFNVIHQTWSYKFDFFPVHTEHGEEELARRLMVLVPGLSAGQLPIVTAEDTILAKLRWYREGGESSSRQWRDVLGVLAAGGDRLDRAYLKRWATRLGITDLYQRALDAADQL